MNKTLTCNIKSVPKIEHKVKRLIRRVIEYVKPTHARIRWDSMANKWAVLQPDNSSDHHFEYGVMRDVKFYTEHLKGYDRQRCAQINENIGVAEGELQENYYGNDATGFVHMSFDQKLGFVSEEKHIPIRHAKILRLMSGRQALVK